MKTQFNLIEGNYKKETDVNIEVSKEETTITRSVINIGELKKQILELTQKINELTAEKIEKENIINSTKDVVKSITL